MNSRVAIASTEVDFDPALRSAAARGASFAPRDVASMAPPETLLGKEPVRGANSAPDAGPGSVAAAPLLPSSARCLMESATESGPRGAPITAAAQGEEQLSDTRMRR